MNYKQLTKEKKAQIDILLEHGLSMRKTAEVLNINHSTIFKYKATIYKKRKIDIYEKYDNFLRYLYTHYDYKTCSIEICVMKFKKQYLNDNCPTFQQVYNWINEGKKTSMMNHTKWNGSYHKKAEYVKSIAKILV